MSTTSSPRRHFPAGKRYHSQILRILTTDSPRLLLVEKDSDDEILIIDALRSAGFEEAIDIVHDGAGALEYLFASERGAANPQFVLLGSTIDGLSVTEVLIRIREQKQTQLIPVVIFGSFVEDDEIRNCYLAGASSYVARPAEFDRFVKAVQAIGTYWLTLNKMPVE